MGDDEFLKLMDGYFAANTTKTVTAQSFLDAAHATYEAPEPGDGPAYLPGDIARRLASAVIVYGTAREAGANRYAAEQMQTRYRERQQREVAVYKDFEAPAGCAGAQGRDLYRASGDQFRSGRVGGDARPRLPGCCVQAGWQDLCFRAQRAGLRGDEPRGRVSHGSGICGQFAA